MRAYIKGKKRQNIFLPNVFDDKLHNNRHNGELLTRLQQWCGTSIIHGVSAVSRLDLDPTVGSTTHRSSQIDLWSLPAAPKVEQLVFYAKEEIPQNSRVWRFKVTLVFFFTLFKIRRGRHRFILQSQTQNTWESRLRSGHITRDLRSSSASKDRTMPGHFKRGFLNIHFIPGA